MKFLLMCMALTAITSPIVQTSPPDYQPNPFTTQICSSDPCNPAGVDPNSATEIGWIMGLVGSFSLGEIQERQPGTEGVAAADFPVYYSGTHDPTYTVVCDGIGNGSCNGTWPQVIRIPNGARAGSSPDHHFIVIDPSNSSREYELWQFNDHGTGTGTTNPVSGGGTVSAAGAGYATSLTMYANNGICSTCTGGPHITDEPGLLDPMDLIHGNIAHELGIAVYCPSHAFVYPAATSDGPHPQCDSGPAEGERIWLNLTDAQIDALGDCSWETTMLHAMHHYGMMVSNTAGAPGPWGYQNVDDWTQRISGGVGNWTLFFNWLSRSCSSTNPHFHNGQSHLLLTTTGILQSNLEVIE